jgi:hypothetical protein
MEERPPRDALLNQGAAFTAAHALDGLGRKQFVLHCLMSAVRRIIAGDIPESPVDMPLLIGCASDLYDRREALARIFAGEDLRWWPDDE